VLVTAGQCSVTPGNPAATTGGGGTGGTLNITYSAVPFSTLPPSKTVNYIIKILPDIITGTTGVTSIQGMTGAITCSGSAIVCAGNVITVNIPSIGVSSLGGMTGAIGCGAGVTCSASTISANVPYVTPADYGFTCDGVTNVTTAFQNMVTSSSGKTIYIPAGPACVLTGHINLVSNLVIMGAGRDVSCIKQTGADYVFNITNLDNVTIKDLCMFSTRAYASWAVTNFGFIFMSFTASHSNFTFQNLAMPLDILGTI